SDHSYSSILNIAKKTHKRHKNAPFLQQLAQNFCVSFAQKGTQSHYDTLNKYTTKALFRQ
ncbi:MAG: hypothetical protein RSD54_02330, partial [Ruthenibacterium sp.]